MNSRPNILLICSDQHNVRTLGAYGNSLISTPHLDRLCREGTCFDAAYCNAPLCVPSRMSFLSGLYPYHCEGYANGSMLDSRCPTYATLLAGAGYHTVLAGRMHLNGQDQYHGFSERLVGDVAPYFYHSAGGSIHYAPLPNGLGNSSKPAPLRTVGAGSTGVIEYDRAVTAATCQWLEQYAARSTRPPFLLTAGFFNPHCPYIAPPELYRKYLGRITVPAVNAAELASLAPVHAEFLKQIEILSIPPENLNKAAAAYYGLVELIDQQIGLILSTLERTGLLDNTVVVYFSDHGEMMGEHGRWHKQCFYEASVRVPLIIRHPELLQRGGQRVGAPVSLVDLLPTLVEWGAARLDYKVDGQSLVPFVRGGGWDAPRPVLAEYYGGGDRMARLGAWKLNYYGRYDYYELFDLEHDPGEERNLAQDSRYAERLAELQRLIFSDGWHRAVHTEARSRWSHTGPALERFWQGLSRDPLLTDVPGYWRQIESCENRLIASEG